MNILLLVAVAVGIEGSPDIVGNEIRNTHMFKARNYNVGRPDYPQAFYEHLWMEAGLTINSVIADIGAGPGKITRGFLEKGNKVYAVEADREMLKILKKNLSQFPNCYPILSTAEKTEIPASSIDLIFCGNSYHWFARNRAIPEFKRIIKDENRTNIVIASLGPCGSAYTKEYLEIEKEFAKPVPQRSPNTSNPFRTDKFTAISFVYIVFDDLNKFLNGSLSSSNAPTPADDSFEAYCQEIKRLFEKYSFNGKIESRFQLKCMLGLVEDLVQ